jgi:prephenate dehydrogenase
LVDATIALNRRVRWQKVTLVGVGLLGGSLGLALKSRQLAERVTGYVRRPASVAECCQAGAVDEAGLDLLAAVRDADLVVLCTPLAQMRALAGQMRPALRRGALVTDVGSVKGPVVRALEPLVAGAGAHFVGSHPMAGAEKMGVGAAQADLFVNAACVLTPTPDSPPAAIERLEALWRAVGARALRLSADVHDELVSRSSHLPHVLAATLASHVLSPAHPHEQALLCANGFRDTTRIASGSPEMWRDICLANAGNLSRALEVFIESLQQLRASLARGDGPALERFLQEAKQRRDQWCAQSASPSPE